MSGIVKLKTLKMYQAEENVRKFLFNHGYNYFLSNEPIR